LLLLLSAGPHEININGASVRKSELKIARNLSEQEKELGIPFLYQQVATVSIAMEIRRCEMRYGISRMPQNP
jgi:hypothetical protein